MSGKKGMQHYPESLKQQIREEYAQGSGQRFLSRKYGVSKYSIREMFLRGVKELERIVLHSDLNNFYASVECLYHPKLRDKPVAVGGSVTEFLHDNISIQLDFDNNQQHREAMEKLESTVDAVRRRFGNLSVQRAVLLQDTRLTGIDPQVNHTIHPAGYFG